MPRRIPKRPRQCPRCGHVQPSTNQQCSDCGTWLVKRRFIMNKARVRLVHTLARRKGLIGADGDKELYHLRLQSVGVETCKKLKRHQFEELVDGMKKLPDVG